jgi:hypothetical protein
LQLLGEQHLEPFPIEEGVLAGEADPGDVDVTGGICSPPEQFQLLLDVVVATALLVFSILLPHDGIIYFLGAASRKPYIPTAYNRKTSLTAATLTKPTRLLGRSSAFCARTPAVCPRFATSARSSQTSSTC